MICFRDLFLLGVVVGVVLVGCLLIAENKAVDITSQSVSMFLEPELIALATLFVDVVGSFEYCDVGTLSQGLEVESSAEESESLRGGGVFMSSTESRRSIKHLLSLLKPRNLLGLVCWAWLEATPTHQ